MTEREMVERLFGRKLTDKEVADLRERAAQRQRIDESLAAFRAANPACVSPRWGVRVTVMAPREMVRGDIFLSVYDCCQREVTYVRGSMWHGESRICRECFSQWYDPDSAAVDQTDPVSIGNYVRSKHGLPPLEVAT